MPTYNDATFRAQFPEFTDPVKYPQATFQVYFGMAQLFIQADGNPFAILNGDALQLALNYLTAQLYTLGQNAAATAANPGADQGGFETSSTIGEISVAKLPPPAKDMWQWWLAQTPYGQALQALLSVLAVGGLYVGGLPEREGFRKIGGVFF